MKSEDISKNDKKMTRQAMLTFLLMILVPILFHMIWLLISDLENVVLTALYPVYLACLFPVVLFYRQRNREIKHEYLKKEIFLTLFLIVCCALIAVLSALYTVLSIEYQFILYCFLIALASRAFFDIRLYYGNAPASV